MRLFYRLAQFWHILTAVSLNADQRANIAPYLSPAELALFDTFSASDQQHSYNVFRLLQTAGHTHPDLLAAALLHDIGKTQVKLTVFDRSLIVLAQRLLPGHVAKWGQGEVQGWKRPFVVKAKHPEWGAALATAAKSRPLTILLIRRHQDTLPEPVHAETDRILAQLQWADDQN